MIDKWLNVEIYTRLLEPLSESGEQQLRASLREGLSEAATDDLVEAAMLIDEMFTSRLANSRGAKSYHALDQVLKSHRDLAAELSKLLDKPRPRSGMSIESILQAWTARTTSPFDMPLMRSVAAIPSTSELLAARRIKAAGREGGDT
jgi:hypothetical protein